MRPLGKMRNEWSANYTYYKHSYNAVFEIFNANNIVPIDLNICCNTVVNGEHIRVIDFRMYDFTTKQDDVQRETIKNWTRY